LFVVEGKVNVTSKEKLYLVGYISRIEGKDIFIKFPYERCDAYEYKYDKTNILPFQTQFSNGKFRAIKLIGSRYLTNAIKLEFTKTETIF